MPAKLFLSANKILEISKNIMGSHKYIYRGILFTPLTLLAQMTLLICSVYNSVFRTVLEWVSHTFQLLFIYRIGNTLLSKKKCCQIVYLMNGCDYDSSVNAGFREWHLFSNCKSGCHSGWPTAQYNVGKYKFFWEKMLLRLPFASLSGANINLHVCRFLCLGKYLHIWPR